ncbi:MAG: glutamate-5-semialdehyde dehydrogenase [Endomicrobiia bacterium]
MKDFSFWEKKIQKVKQASYKFSSIDESIKNEILKEIKQEIIKLREKIFSANKKDVFLAERSGVSKAVIDRLILNDKRIEEIINAIETVLSLESPVNKVINMWERSLGKDNNFVVKKITVPIGVILIIYESRPNVTVDSVALCIKSSNCVILRGGKETINTNKVLVEIVNKSINKILKKSNFEFSKDIVLFIDDPSYNLLYKILSLQQYIDLVIPRGSEKMVNIIKEKSLIPILSHGSGVCHTYVDKEADIDVALKVCLNAKVQRPAVCNAMEKLLVHKDIAEKFLPSMAKMYIEHNVELRGCKKTKMLLDKYAIKIKLANEQDWYKEYLDYILAIKIVNNIDEAIKHINHYGSHHSDAIITKNVSLQEKFEKEVDSSAIFINSSTRLHDGGVFGFGTEIGISTSKLHARGTMGLNELVTTKYIVEGNGAIRV